MLSVILPTLNAGPHLGATLAALGRPAFQMEVVVADGGSTDATRAVAEQKGARIVMAAQGRGRQLRAGAGAATGDWLLFLHADTRLGPAWAAAVDAFMADAAGGGRAGVFRLVLDDAAPAARRVEILANWRARTFGLPYGDQGLLVSRAFYDALGGFDAVPLMEDVALVRRIGKKRLVFLGANAVTDAEKYKRDGYWLRPLRNLLCLALYFSGASPATIERLYR